MKGRRGIAKLVIILMAIDPASAANVANYGVSIRGTRSAPRAGRVASRHSIGIIAAAYDAARRHCHLTLQKSTPKPGDPAPDRRNPQVGELPGHFGQELPEVVAPQAATTRNMAGTLTARRAGTSLLSVRLFR